MDAQEKEDIAVVTITHDMEFVARNFKRVVAMAHKNIIADGTAAEIFSSDAQGCCLSNRSEVFP